MFGDNPCRKKTPDTGTLWVEEIFKTLQGEGPFCGMPSVFVRLSGCNLRCYWCDTQFERFQWSLSPEQILHKIRNLEAPIPKLVVITGGEPLRQSIGSLIALLLSEDFEVQIETNGTIYQDIPKDTRVSIVCSPKTPEINRDLTPRITHYKYVLAHNEIHDDDGLPCTSTQQKGAPIILYRPSPGTPIYVMPRDDYDPERNAKNLHACVHVALKYGYRVTIQLHKMLNIP